MILISNDFWLIIKMYNFESYNVLLSIATNIPVLLMIDCVSLEHRSSHKQHRYKRVRLNLIIKDLFGLASANSYIHCSFPNVYFVLFHTYFN